MGVHGLWSKGPPPGPIWLLWIKIAIIVLSVIVLALSAYALSLYGRYSDWSYIGAYSGAAGLLIFVVIKTWIIYGALIFLELRAPQYYYRLIGIIGYTLGVIFWLSGWAWAASYASFWLSLNRYCYNGLGCADLSDSGTRAFGGSMAGCAAIGAVIWILSIVNLVFFVRGCLADEGTAVTTTTHNAELGHVPKQAEAHTQPQPAYGAQPQQVYGQQPVYGQQQPAYGAQPQQAYPPQQQQAPYAGSPPPQQQPYPPQ
jgi:hypothetical protein